MAINYLQTAHTLLSAFLVELRSPATWHEVGNELFTVVKHSFWPGLALIILVLLDLDLIILLASWAIVMFVAKRIRKTEKIMYDKIGKHLYKSRIFLVKMAGLFLALVAAKLGLEGVQWTSLQIMEENSSRFGGIEKLIAKMIIKWLAFIQYFTFYQLYLNFFTALGYYVAPKLKTLENSSN